MSGAPAVSGPRRLLLGAVLIMMLSLPRAAIARPEGIIGNSGKQGLTCTDGNCHSGAVPPRVRLEGPDQLDAGALATFRLVVESQSPKQQFAGFNVAASAGELGLGSGDDVRAEVGELTHVSPKFSDDGVTFWDFTWQAPAEAGAQTLFGAGLSANGNGNRNGDDASTTTLVVTVHPPPQPGDANCDQRLSAADVSAVISVFGGQADMCALADANCDSAVDDDDLVLLQNRLFESRVGPAECH